MVLRNTYMISCAFKMHILKSVFYTNEMVVLKTFMKISLFLHLYLIYMQHTMYGSAASTFN